MANETLALVQEKPAQYLDQDGLWKKVITDLFKPFMLFFAPDLYDKLDWSRMPDSLEQELHRTFPVIEGKRYTDKLMKIHLKDGKEQWILAHIEVQGYKDDDFSERMFQYFYRIFDKYQQKIFTIALLADPDRSFKPTVYDYHFHGTTLTYIYNTYKFLDQDEEELLQSDNPFAYVVLAGIYTLKSKKMPANAINSSVVCLN
ncbi:Rpn family recombination-promoting nuclease/putative transposase [Salicibibacter cibi]|uniref:Rpn family recombination-promoting nuclease/putative transposase n=1 Tax=Salicibibacter cibi TaxID=2743001 RepID=A0A7T6Z9I5_9BACI|nr:Rpn family recombination-promoting nuclease/putative transposase [Salicibibacter cibi]QQK79300.1 Rpn family recombination-promoting nuclease/putative transposase [Salicibibacter cibi]